jgi:hypothetical protein
MIGDPEATILHNSRELRRGSSLTIWQRNPPPTSLAGHADHVLNDRWRKFSFFCNWPLTLLNLLDYLTDLRFRCFCVHSADRAQGRSAARIAFNDPNDFLYIRRIYTTAYRTLRGRTNITSVAMSVDSVILHHACADYVFIDVPANANSILQSLRCALRRQSYSMVLLTLDHSYDQALQARAANKILGQITDQNQIEVIEAIQAGVVAADI